MSMHTRFLGSCAAAGLLLVSGAAVAGTLDGSAHDFAGQWTGAELCNVCHAPHNNEVNASNNLLWNHEQSAVTNYTLYLGLDLQGTMDQPTGVSKLCLSCHDGTVAPDSFGGATGGATIDAAANFGTDFSNDHPISITYSTTDPELNATSSTVVWADGVTPDGTVADLLEGGATGTVECSSCHDVHNTRTSGLANNFLLVVDNANSALCTTCHGK